MYTVHKHQLSSIVLSPQDLGFLWTLLSLLNEHWIMPAINQSKVDDSKVYVMQELSNDRSMGDKKMHP